MIESTYSEEEFIINLVITSSKSLNPLVISQKIKKYFDLDIDDIDISYYINNFEEPKKKSFTLKMSDIF